MRAFVKNAVQSVGAERLGNANLLLLLVTEVVKGEAFRQQRVDLRGAGLGDLLRGKEIFHIRGNIYLAQLQPIVQRIPGECAIGTDHHQRHTQHLHAFADALRQRRRRAVKGVAGLWIHQYGAVQLFDSVDHIPHQTEVGHKLLGRDTAQMPHQPFLAHKAVGGADNVEWAGIEDRGGDFQVYEAGVIHQDQTGLVSTQPLHADAAAVKIGGLQIGGGEEVQQCAEEDRGFERLPVLCPWQNHDILVGFVGDLNLHALSPCSIC